MPFSYRVFCRDLESPSLSELSIWLRQQGHTPRILKAWPSADLMSSFWIRAELETGDGADSVRVDVACLRADAAGIQSLTAEVNDFRNDVAELSDTPARGRVLEHLDATRSVVVVEFAAGDDDTSDRAEEIGASILTLFVERSRGLAQRDGAGFFDEDDDVILALG